jgi:hypothetical protein
VAAYLGLERVEIVEERGGPEDLERAERRVAEEVQQRDPAQARADLDEDDPYLCERRVGERRLDVGLDPAE